MGTTTFIPSHRLLEQGFHLVLVPAARQFGGWEAGNNQYHFWCLENCQGEFALRKVLGGDILGYFQMGSDATLFALRWS